MTELQPHRHPRPTAPLSAGARFIRGFTRIGAIAALLVVLIGVPSSIGLAVSTYGNATSSHESAQCIARLARSGYTFKKKYDYGSALDYSVGGCAGYHHSYETVSEVIAIADQPTPTFLTSLGPSTLGWGFLATGLTAIVIYLAFWAIGWMFAGFTRDA
ncbi:hypothetical protein SAMN05443247_05504 [Bradyrhizobium erythrophlei]|nr:hypothetical protein SAMN05443247_05504 [Bradyrhizobium erythrophlei]